MVRVTIVALLGALFLSCGVAIADDEMRYWTSYTKSLGETTNDQLQRDNSECNAELRAAASNGWNFRFGPPLWVDMHELFARNDAKDRAWSFKGQCMRGRGWTEINRKDFERAILKRGTWTNYPEPLDTSVPLSCIRDMASPDRDEPSKPLRLDTALFDKYMALHSGWRLVDKAEADRIRLLRHQQKLEK